MIHPWTLYIYWSLKRMGVAENKIWFEIFLLQRIFLCLIRVIDLNKELGEKVFFQLENTVAHFQIYLLNCKSWSNPCTYSYFLIQYTKRIEYILEGNLLEKKCKTAILLYCFHTAGVLYIFVLYKLLGPGISF